jgi:HPt (histidine-containing phosphotransfer) domain-containing protein
MSDLFADRMAAIRRRFILELDARIDEIEFAVPQAGRDGEFHILALAHRQAHGLCGIGPTLGFVGTGKAARLIEQLLLPAVKAERPLTDDEVPRLRESIALLRSTARAEIAPAQQLH